MVLVRKWRWWHTCRYGQGWIDVVCCCRPVPHSSNMVRNTNINFCARGSKVDKASECPGRCAGHRRVGHVQPYLTFVNQRPRASCEYCWTRCTGKHAENMFGTRGSHWDTTSLASLINASRFSSTGALLSVTNCSQNASQPHRASRCGGRILMRQSLYIGGAGST